MIEHEELRNIWIKGTIDSITWGHYHILKPISFPSQGQNHIFSLSFRQEGISCPLCHQNPISTPLSEILPSISSIQLLSQTVCAVRVGLNLFAPYKTKIYNNLQCVTIFSSSPLTLFTLQRHLCETEKTSNLRVIDCVHSKFLSLLLTQVHILECVH